MKDAFILDLLERAKLMQESKNQIDEIFKVRSKLKLTENQIEVLAERIATLPNDFELKPLLDQLSKLQKNKGEIESLVHQLENKHIEKDEPVSFESLAAFRKSLKGLIKKGELDKNVQTAIIKKIVHKITIKPNGFKIHFQVGKTYYAPELGTRP